MYSLHKNEYRIFKPVEITITRGLRKKKNRVDEPIWVTLRIYVEVSQGNSLCSYLKQTKMSFFFFYKIGAQEGGTGELFGTSGRGQEVGKGRGKVNIVQILCTCVYK
jgi:hypothetical protein